MRGAVEEVPLRSMGLREEAVGDAIVCLTIPGGGRAGCCNVCFLSRFAVMLFLPDIYISLLGNLTTTTC